MQRPWLARKCLKIFNDKLKMIKVSIFYNIIRLSISIPKYMTSQIIITHVLPKCVINVRKMKAWINKFIN